MKTTLQARIEKCRGSARFSQEVQELLLRECELAEEKLSAQESELTKLRKRVDVLEKWNKDAYAFLVTFSRGDESVFDARDLMESYEALAESAKIAG